MCVQQSKTHIIIIIRYVYTQLQDYDDDTCVRIKYMMECDVVQYFPFATAAAAETNTYGEFITTSIKVGRLR